MKEVCDSVTVFDPTDPKWESERQRVKPRNVLLTFLGTSKDVP